MLKKYNQETPSVLEWHEELGTDPVAVIGIDGHRKPGGGREPVCKHQIAVRGELTGWCGTGRPNLSHETAFSSAIVDKKNIFFLSRLRREGLATKPRWIHALLNVLTVQISVDIYGYGTVGFTTPSRKLGGIP